LNSVEIDPSRANGRLRRRGLSLATRARLGHAPADTKFVRETPMHRPIPGARFIAGVLGAAGLFGGAAALADAGRLGVTQFVAVPAAAPEPVLLAEAEAIAVETVPPALSEPEAKTADALVKDAAKAAEAALAGLLAPDEPAARIASDGLPRLRPEPAELDNAG
jgi:hypothetical protein